MSIIAKLVNKKIMYYGQILDAASEQVTLDVAQPYNNHNGGNIAFGSAGLVMEEAEGMSSRSRSKHPDLTVSHAAYRCRCESGGLE